MRKLGAALGVEAMALYRHVANKEALLDGVVEVLTQEIEIPRTGSGPWPEALRRVVHSYRSVARAHPHAFPLIALRPLTTPGAIARGEATIQLLRDAGVDDRRAVLTFRTLVSYANGYLLEELSTAAPHFTTGEPEVEFEWGLRAVLAGLEAELRVPDAPAGSSCPPLRGSGR